MYGPLRRLGTWAANRHWRAIAGWLVVLAALLVVRAAFGGNFLNDYSVPGSQSSDGLSFLKKQFPQQGGYAGQIVFHARSGSVADDKSAVDQAMGNVATLPHVIAATSPFDAQRVSKDGTIAYGPVSWNIMPASLESDYLHQLDAAVKPARSAGLQVEYGGGAGQIDSHTSDLTSELIGIICALVLLLIMFSSLAAAVIPLLSAVCSVLSGLAIVTLLAALTHLPTAAPTVATLLGLGVAIDYGLFLLARHREHLDHGVPVQEAAGRSTATSGGAVVVAGSTVVVAILGLYVAGVPFVGAMGAASAIVVAVTMIAALTLTPALMGLAGRHAQAMTRFAHRRHEGTDHGHEQSAFARWGQRVSDRPLPWGIAALVLLCVLSIPLFSLRLGQLDAGTNPTSQSIRRAYDLVDQGFGPGANGPLTVAFALPEESQSQTQQLLTSAQQKLAATPDVASASSPTVNSAGTAAVITVVPKTAPQNAATTDLVDRLRNSVLPGLGTRTYLVGTTAAYADFTEKVSARMPWLILAVIALAFILLTIAFRSIVIALKAGILNLLSVGAAYGVIVAVFQWGWGSSAVGIEEKLPIPAFVPMLMFAIVFGLSMDYEVFLLSRVHEAWVRTGDPHRSVAIGIGGTARVITTAAGIMIVVFISFVLSVDPIVKMLAVGMAAAVLIDASIIRMVLVPAIMSLLGRWAWWMPSWLARVTPSLDIEGSRHEAEELDRERERAQAVPAQPA